MSKAPKKANKIIPIILVFLIASISFLVVFFTVFQAVNSNDQSTVTFVIPKGQAVAQIGQRLKDQGLIRSRLAFRYVIHQDKLQQKIQAGSFKLSPSMTTWDLAQALTRGTDDLWLTLPEGWRREEIAASLNNQDLADFEVSEFLILTQGLEGQLFPDTYLVSRAISTQAVVNLLTNTFESKIETNLAKEISNSALSLNQILTLASLVQRESASDTEMPLVAGILFNRLDIDMPLQVDATLQYIKGYSQTEQTWWPTPLAVDKKLTSPYNTYQNPGLPPTPICNPGLAAVKAVLYPKSTNALYYLHDLSGQIHTAQTLAEHNANVNEYLR